MSSKVGTLAPTDGIKDPQVRAFCDSLANVWQLRNGNIGRREISSAVAPATKAAITVSSGTRVPATRTTPSGSAVRGGASTGKDMDMANSADYSKAGAAGA